VFNTEFGVTGCQVMLSGNDPEFYRIRSFDAGKCVLNIGNLIRTGAIQRYRTPGNNPLSLVVTQDVVPACLVDNRIHD
jgi:hypothetical protein